MKYNELQIEANRGRKRVGRGISAGGGKTAGRGTKGQNARTGKKLRSMFQGGQNGIQSAVPKGRGFKSLRTGAQVVYLDRLNDLKGSVDNFTLYEADLIATPFHTVKVILRGELTSKITTLKVQAASKSVIAAVEKVGGKFEKVPTPIQKSAKEAEAEDKQ